jgi:hypothetical protein
MFTPFTSNQTVIVRKKPKRRNSFEGNEQTLLYLWWNSVVLPDFQRCLFHIPNGGKREKKLITKKDGTKRWVCLDGKKLKSQGARSGVLDNFLMVPAYDLCGLWIEMKPRKKESKTAKPSKEQEEFSYLANRMGYGVKVAYGYEEAKKAVLEYLVGSKFQAIFKKGAIDWDTAWRNSA